MSIVHIWFKRQRNFQKICPFLLNIGYCSICNITGKETSLLTKKSTSCHLLWWRCHNNTFCCWEGDWLHNVRTSKSAVKIVADPSPAGHKLSGRPPSWQEATVNQEHNHNVSFHLLPASSTRPGNTVTQTHFLLLGWLISILNLAKSKTLLCIHGLYSDTQRCLRWISGCWYWLTCSNNWLPVS